MDIKEILDKAREFEKTDIEWKRKIMKAWKKHKEFVSRYPFRKHPEEIDSLTGEKIYNPGTDDYFFNWIEHKLKNLGYIRIGSALIWENARNNIDLFKELLKKAINDSIPMAQKIDANWEDIKFFGGDKNVAKKIIWCYYPEKFLPIFKTEDLEHFAKTLGLNYERKAVDVKGLEYEKLSTGQKFELLNEVLLAFKKEHSEFENWDNALFTRFLYCYFRPEHPPYPDRKTQSEPLPQHLGLLFAPSNEQELIFLFALLHQELGFPYIMKVRDTFPDAEVMNKQRESKKIEFELLASSFIQHRHDPSGCDYIVCWEDDLQEDIPEEFPEVIAIKDLISNLK